jgi:hypothetical protein
MSANATESYGKPSLQLRTSVDHSIRVTSGARDVRDSRTKEATRPPVLSGNGNSHYSSDKLVLTGSVSADHYAQEIAALELCRLSRRDWKSQLSAGQRRSTAN